MLGTFNQIRGPTKVRKISKRCVQRYEVSSNMVLLFEFHKKVSFSSEMQIPEQDESSKNLQHLWETKCIYLLSVFRHFRIKLGCVCVCVTNSPIFANFPQQQTQWETLTLLGVGNLGGKGVKRSLIVLETEVKESSTNGRNKETVCILSS